MPDNWFDLGPWQGQGASLRGQPMYLYLRLQPCQAALLATFGGES